MEYKEKLMSEIIEMIKTNLEILYNFDDDSMVNIKKYCKENNGNKYQSLPYLQLLYFVDEAIADLINAPYLYDFRT